MQLFERKTEMASTPELRCLGATISHFFLFALMRFTLILQEELCKTFFETTLPTSMEKFQNILRKRNEGNNFFLGDKVRQKHDLYQGITKCKNKK